MAQTVFRLSESEFMGSDDSDLVNTVSVAFFGDNKSLRDLFCCKL